MTWNNIKRLEMKQSICLLSYLWFMFKSSNLIIDNQCYYKRVQLFLKLLTLHKNHCGTLKLQSQQPTLKSKTHVNWVKTKETYSNLISPHVPDVGEQEEQLRLPPRLLLGRASRLADVMNERVGDDV